MDPPPPKLHCQQVHTCYRECGHFATAITHAQNCFHHGTRKICSHLISSKPYFTTTITRYEGAKCEWCIDTSLQGPGNIPLSDVVNEVYGEDAALGRNGGREMVKGIEQWLGSSSRFSRPRSSEDCLYYPRGHASMPRGSPFKLRIGKDLILLLNTLPGVETPESAFDDAMSIVHKKIIDDQEADSDFDDEGFYSNGDASDVFSNMNDYLAQNNFSQEVTAFERFIKSSRAHKEKPKSGDGCESEISSRSFILRADTPCWFPPEFHEAKAMLDVY